MDIQTAAEPSMCLLGIELEPPQPEICQLQTCSIPGNPKPSISFPRKSQIAGKVTGRRGFQTQREERITDQTPGMFFQKTGMSNNC